MSKLLEGLTEEQREAASYLHGALLVLAPVGTGKTETIARRAAYAIENGIEPQKMLCLSFTNKAANEMRDRIEHLLAESGGAKQIGNITVCTFHSFCVRLLRLEADTLALAPDFSIYDEEDSRHIVAALRQAYEIKVEPKVAHKLDRTYYDFIQRAKIDPYQTKSPLSFNQIFNDCLNASTIKERDIDLHQDFFLSDIFEDYRRALAESQALDFADLLTKVIDLFKTDSDALLRWQSFYDWIQVDEVQDTSVPEYWILSMLARARGHLAFFGDTNQTIYEWRDSKPLTILPRFETDFAPVKKITLEHNHRSTPNLLNAAISVTNDDISNLLRDLSPQEIKRGGAKVKLHEAQSLADEAFWIAGEIRRLCETRGYSYRDMVVISRRHDLNEKLAGHLRFCGVPIYLVEDSKFFARAEIKDALAYLRLLLNPSDLQALRRILSRTFDSEAFLELQTLSKAMHRVHLRLYDFLNLSAQYNDVFQPLIEAFESNTLVALDFEATGKNPFQDDAIEVAAVRFGASGETARFHRYIKPTKPVGASEKIHQLSDAFLQENGRDAKIVFGALLDFIGDSILIGHNIGFDIELLKNNLRRNELDLMDFAVFDTLDLSRRLLKLPNYRLTTVCEHLGLTLPTHRALDDAVSTFELLKALVPKLIESATRRRALIDKYGSMFKPLALQFQRWRRAMNESRPQILLERILDETGLRETTFKEVDGERKLAYLSDLSQRFSELDRKANPRESLQFLLEQSALGFGGFKVVEEKVPLVTAHQSKGLEFKVVFIAGATDTEFPHWLNSTKKGVEQERKLLYVAMTRAKQRLYISFFNRNERDFKQNPSRFIANIPPELVEWI